MIKIGILGDIGSGKSYVAKQFGYPVFNADTEVHKLYKNEIKIFKKLQKKLPKFVYSFPINKKEISAAILADQNNLKKINGWNVERNKDSSYFLIKKYSFKNFKDSQDFVNKVSDIAEQENHHPDIFFGWGYCKVKIFTHAIKGLAESDFILAAKIDNL